MSDDIFAAATERAFARMSISVPDRLSIISFNNSLLARLTSSQLTSIDINPFRLGTESAEQLISLIGSHESCAKKIIIPHRLTIRSSCAPPPEE